MAQSVETPVGLLAAAVSDGRFLGDPAVRVTGIAYDSRLVEPGFLFAALPGAYADGHDFVATAVDRGASTLLVERERPEPVAQIVVPTAAPRSARVAAAFYREPSREISTIGVTGTDGKTTTSFLVDAILRAAGFKTGLVGTVAIKVGDEVDVHQTRQTTPESADIQQLLRRMADAGVSWATVEATSHGLAMHRLDGTRFRIGAVTNITSEHLDYHGTVENYRGRRGSSFERVADNNGTAVINVDDPGARTMLDFARGANVVTYSTDGKPSDVRAG
jgi:UDP-N-acetylmuramoyl-L-alanyl-D-glutamate--2,6-diaminopimelate ligase